MSPYSSSASTSESAMPLESFIQAVQSQLDKAQTAMTWKARNLNICDQGYLAGPARACRVCKE
jgi:hypothetical protein